MIIEVRGGLGDEVAATAVVREYKRQHPDELVRVYEPTRPAIWLHNPWVNVGKTDNGKHWCLRMDTEWIIEDGSIYSWKAGGSAPHRHAAQLGFQLVDDTPEIWLTDFERGENWGIERPDRTIAIDVGAGWPSKRWPYGRWFEVVTALTAEGWDVIELGKRMRVVGEETKPMPFKLSFFAKRSIRETAAILSHCALFLGHDSGLFHLAAAVGTPQVVVFGGTRWSDYAYHNTTPVYPYSNCGEHCYKECYRPPKVKGRFTHCMDEISAQRVLETARMALRRWPFLPAPSRPETRIGIPRHTVVKPALCVGCGVRA